MATDFRSWTKFIGELRAIWAAESENGCRMERAKLALESFVMEPSLKAHSANWPSTEGHKNLLLYVDLPSLRDQRGRRKPAARSVARPRRCLGALRHARRHREPRAATIVSTTAAVPATRIKLASVTTGHGQGRSRAAACDPREQGGPDRSFAIIVRKPEARAGTVLQGRYDPKTNTPD